MALAQVAEILRAGIVPPDVVQLLRQVEAEQRRATRLLFFPIGRQPDGGLTVWRVGPESAPVDFPARTAGVQRLHWLVTAGVVGMPTEYLHPSGAEAVRQALKRGREEIETHCPALANALLCIEIGKTRTTYEPRAMSVEMNTHAKPTCVPHRQPLPCFITQDTKP